MELPAELKVPAPRDVSGAASLFKKNQSMVRRLFIGGPITFGAVLVIGWVKFDEISIAIIAGAIGISMLVELFAMAMLLQSRRAMKLYREGIATIGRVTKVKAPGDRQGNAYVFIDVEFSNDAGQRLTGKVSTLGKQA